MSVSKLPTIEESLGQVINSKNEEQGIDKQIKVKNGDDTIEIQYNPFKFQAMSTPKPKGFQSAFAPSLNGPLSLSTFMSTSNRYSWQSTLGRSITSQLGKSTPSIFQLSQHNPLQFKSNISLPIKSVQDQDQQKKNSYWKMYDSVPKCSLICSSRISEIHDSHQIFNQATTQPMVQNQPLYQQFNISGIEYQKQDTYLSQQQFMTSSLKAYHLDDLPAEKEFDLLAKPQIPLFVNLTSNSSIPLLSRQSALPQVKSELNPPMKPQDQLLNSGLKSLKDYGNIVREENTQNDNNQLYLPNTNGQKVVASPIYFQPKTIIQLTKTTSSPCAKEQEELKRARTQDETETEQSIGSSGEESQDKRITEIVTRDQISDAKVRAEIPESVYRVEVVSGDRFDSESLKIDEAIPGTREFKIYKYKNPKTQRFVKILKCEHVDCGMFFRKWHNFFDHLRVHTKERPFKCQYNGCTQAFTQKANLNKHIEVHKKKKKFYCRQCKKYYTATSDVNHHAGQCQL